jgi:hypothetical protein
MLGASARAFAGGCNVGDGLARARGFRDDATFVNRFGRLVDGRAATIAMVDPISGQATPVCEHRLS